MLGCKITNPKLLTLELSQCPAGECLTACTWLTKLSVWSSLAEDSLVSLVNLSSLRFSVARTDFPGTIQTFPIDFFLPFTVLTTLWLEGMLDDRLFEAVSQVATLTQLVVLRSPPVADQEYEGVKYNYLGERTCHKSFAVHLCKLQLLQVLHCKFLCIEFRLADESEDRMLYAASLAEASDFSPDVLSEAGYQTRVKISQMGWWGT